MKYMQLLCSAFAQIRCSFRANDCTRYIQDPYLCLDWHRDGYIYFAAIRVSALWSAYATGLGTDVEQPTRLDDHGVAWADHYAEPVFPWPYREDASTFYLIGLLSGTLPESLPCVSDAYAHARQAHAGGDRGFRHLLQFGEYQHHGCLPGLVCTVSKRVAMLTHFPRRLGLVCNRRFHQCRQRQSAACPAQARRNGLQNSARRPL